DGTLYAGMYGQVKFLLPDDNAPIVAPANAFVFRAQGPQVATVTGDNRIHWQKISVGRDFGTQIEVLDGLKENNKVVMNPTDDLDEGIAVQVKPVEKPKPEGTVAQSRSTRREQGCRRNKEAMDKNREKVKLLARDLRDGKQFPRSPRQTLAGYVLAARAVDKCGAVLAGWGGGAAANCPLDQRWLKFAEIDDDDFRSLVATGATDEKIAEWIGDHAKKRPRAEIIAWNNKERDLHLSDLPLDLQEYMEDYIQQFIPRNRVVHHWFDVYDLEEERI